MSYDSVILATGGLISYWKLNETSGTSIADVGGASNTGTLHGGFTLNQSALDQDGEGCITFDGTGYISFAQRMTGGAALRSWELQIRATDDVQNTQCLFQDGSINGNTEYRVLRGSTTKSLSDDQNQTGVTNSCLKNTNYHVVETYSVTNGAKLYINGTLIVTAAGAIGAPTGAKAWIAAQANNTDTVQAGSMWIGKIAKVAAYNVELGPSIVTAHYNAFAAPASNLGSSSRHSPRGSQLRRTA